MEKKERDWYFIFLFGCVDPNLHGPYTTRAIRDEEMDRMRKEEGEENHSYISLDCAKGGNIKA